MVLQQLLSFFPTTVVERGGGPPTFKDQPTSSTPSAVCGAAPRPWFVIVNADNASAMEAVAGLKHPIFTFGLVAADCTPPIRRRWTAASIDVMIAARNTPRRAHVTAPQCSQRLAAASAAWALGLPGHAVETGLALHRRRPQFRHKVPITGGGLR
ncbi:MAG: hypothetical protein ACLTYN_00920 [Dysosmobacter welbionis]